MKPKMDVKLVHVILTLWVCWVCSAEEQVTNGERGHRPNILVIVADDLGYGDIGCYGNTTLRTPNIDRLAKEGAKFTHAISAASICTPSRAALLTGRYPIRTGLTTSGLARVVPFLACTGGLTQQEETFAAMAKKYNYSTALMGKWHLGLHCNNPFDYCHHPLKHGFDSFYGLPWSNSRDLGGEEAVIDARLPNLRISLVSIILVSFVTVLWLRSKEKSYAPYVYFAICFCGIAVPALMCFVVSNLRLLNGVVMRNYTVVEQPVRIEGIHKRFVNEAQDFIRVQHDQQQPFLVLLTFTHSHTALIPTREFLGRSKHGLYGDIVEELDSGVGQILSFLEELKILNDTFIVFTSDNGAHLEEVGLDGSRQGGYNGPLTGGKGMGAWEGGIRLPFLVRYPKLVEVGSLVEQAVSFMDVYPTIANLVGAPVEKLIDGQDLMPLFNNEKKNERFLVHYCGTSIHAARWIVNETHVWKAVFATPNWLPNTTHCQFLCSCRDKDVTFHDPPIMYNIAKDLSESHPISFNSPEYQVALKAIKEHVVRHRESIIPVASQLAWWKSLWLPWLQPCCNFPLCSCTEDKYSFE